MKKYHIATLGCRTNQYESELFSEQLQSIGYVETDEAADLCIINTCSVTNQANATCRRQIRQQLLAHPTSRVVVTGCMAASHAAALQSMDPRIEVMQNLDKEHLISKLLADENLKSSIARFEGHTRAFIKVQDGCNSFCTYCIVPYTRGRSRSRPLTDVIEEVKNLISNGFREVVLTGINIGDYKADQVCLADLVRAIDRLEGIERIRISSIDPDEVGEDLADAVLNGRHTCPSLHLSLQSGSNVILKRMNRKYTRQIFLDTVQRLGQANSDFTFTTDIIVGFPGESDADFADTLDIVREVRFAKVHLFPYSVRSMTRAASYQNRVSAKVVNQRKEELAIAADKAAFANREKYLHRTMEVLLEEGDDHFISGHTSNFLQVQLSRGPYRPNELVQVEILENTPLGLKGKVL